MSKFLKLHDSGPEVRRLQQLLLDRGYPAHTEGTFDKETKDLVRAFQSQNLDQHGNPLVVDGKVGSLTWWSLENPKPRIQTPAAVDFRKMPPVKAGGSKMGRKALGKAIKELRDEAGEVGGGNRGPWIRKYLAPAGLEDGHSWCAGFASWCYLKASGSKLDKMPFPYSASARDLMNKMRNLGYTSGPADNYEPKPGDLVFWWRVRADGWQGHVGLVYELKDGMLYTIEGNRSPKVQGFSYVASRMEKLLGYGHVPL
ncbi:MAG: CHAP domain-containing protein [Acidimicrobiia bacterium]|nr:CHAP domain-containing protein [Acidimicrobiia bacterium]